MTSHYITAGVPLENYRVMVGTAVEYGVYLLAADIDNYTDYCNTTISSIS